MSGQASCAGRIGAKFGGYVRCTSRGGAVQDAARFMHRQLVRSATEHEAAMSKNDTEFDLVARRHIADGLNKVVDAAKVGLGPWGRRMLAAPTVATEGSDQGGPEAQLAKHFEGVGAQMAVDVRARTSAAVGDGTTTAIILAQWIYVEGMALVNAGANVTDVVQGIDTAVAVVVSELSLHSVRVRTRREMVHVATTSTGGDQTVGDLVVDAVERAGKAVVTLPATGSFETSLEFVSGMRFERGYASPYFVTNSERAEALLEDACVLIHAGVVRQVRELSPLLEQVAKAAIPLLIIAEIEGEALATLVANKIKGRLQVCAVSPPGSGEERQRMLTDIARASGCSPTPIGSGPGLGAVSLKDLGRVKTVIVTECTTTLLSGRGSDADDSQSSAGSIGVIRVGAATDGELREKRRRVESALGATLAASDEGIVPGGGFALLRTLPALTILQVPAALQSGVHLVAKALEQPLRRFVENGGLQGSAVVTEVCERRNGFGYNAISGEYEDLAASGVMDATKVVRVALQSAALVACKMLTTEPLMAMPAQASSSATSAKP